MKADEIKALKALVEMDGYFAEYFKKDLDKMIENIKNDHPIEMGTQFNASAEYFQSRCDELVKKHALEILELCDTLLFVHKDIGDTRLYEHAEAKIGKRNVITRKRFLGINVTNEEVDYLIQALELKS